ncbi:hypothetical protein DUI87_24552 [Hirundo rustica rustica]|uniref:MiT/TFE transcription factors N-terminal domain-containing protein n=1 Tax=Hirundo rustica rustica TaxID=333673 RepID=A0A3M0JVM6_HIRRU|nr:hypothetical protein DUI87_24552 [Hirundo rustica rustica]
MTSRILLRQQLMREQMQEQERREQQQKQQAAQFMQQRVPVSQTPAINVSVPTSLPPATQVPMEVLKTYYLLAELPDLGKMVVHHVSVAVLDLQKMS